MSTGFFTAPHFIAFKIEPVLPGEGDTGGAAMQQLPKTLTSNIQQLFRRRSPGDPQLGQVLVVRGIITEKQLNTALAAQRQRLIETGQAVRLGHMITELGLASSVASAVTGLNCL